MKTTTTTTPVNSNYILIQREAISGCVLQYSEQTHPILKNCLVKVNKLSLF